MSGGDLGLGPQPSVKKTLILIIVDPRKLKNAKKHFSSLSVNFNMF